MMVHRIEVSILETPDGSCLAVPALTAMVHRPSVVRPPPPPSAIVVEQYIVAVGSSAADVPPKAS